MVNFNDRLSKEATITVGGTWAARLPVTAGQKVSVVVEPSDFSGGVTVRHYPVGSANAYVVATYTERARRTIEVDENGDLEIGVDDSDYAESGSPSQVFVRLSRG